MKTLLILLFPLSLFAQKSEKILQFVDKNMGKKVGEGKCLELITGAYHKADRNWEYTKVKKYGSVVDSADLKPGDVITFTDIVCFDESKLSSHIVIVYSVDNGAVMVAEQNCQGSKKDSKVVLTPLKDLYRPSYVSQITKTYYRLN